jgi:hypothetical protein
MHLGAAVAPTNIAEEILHISALQIPPALLVQFAAGDINRGIAVLSTILPLGLDLPERSTRQISLPTRGIEPVLGRHIDRPTERIEPKHRVRAFNIERTYRHLRQNLPVHRVAERRVEPCAIDIDRKPLLGPLQRRCGKTVIQQCRLERIA